MKHIIIIIHVHGFHGPHYFHTVNDGIICDYLKNINDIELLINLISSNRFHCIEVMMMMMMKNKCDGSDVRFSFLFYKEKKKNRNKR